MSKISTLSKNITLEQSITLCAIDCLIPQYAAKALERSAHGKDFAQILLFSHKHVSGIHNNIRINKINSIESYNYFLLKDLSNYIQTDYVLIVQWDGFIVNHNIWTNDFLDCDYIGAVWPQYQDRNNVGNGGFSLRSKRLLLALSEIEIPENFTIPEDELICRMLRNKLERDFNIKYATSDLANLFSYEQTKPTFETFGFHGFWNMIEYIDEIEAIEIVNQMPDKYFRGYLMMKTLMSSFYKDYNILMSLIYKKVITQIGEDTFRKTLEMALKFNEKDVEKCFRKSRKMMIHNEISS